jgi:hypothetical protein
MKKTHLQLMKANVLMDEYYKKNKENKLCASILKFSKQLQSIFDIYNDELDTIQLKNCAVDPVTKVILKDEKGNRQFTIEGNIKLKEESKLLINKEVEITPIIAEDIEDLIKELSEDQIEIFSGIIIP